MKRRRKRGRHVTTPLDQTAMTAQKASINQLFVAFRHVNEVTRAQNLRCPIPFSKQFSQTCLWIAEFSFNHVTCSLVYPFIKSTNNIFN